MSKVDDELQDSARFRREQRQGVHVHQCRCGVDGHRWVHRGPCALREVAACEASVRRVRKGRKEQA